VILHGLQILNAPVRPLRVRLQGLKGAAHLNGKTGHRLCLLPAEALGQGVVESSYGFGCHTKDPVRRRFYIQVSPLIIRLVCSLAHAVTFFFKWDDPPLSVEVRAESLTACAAYP